MNRLEEIKQALESWKRASDTHPIHFSAFIGIEDVEWLIAEVQRLSSEKP